MALRDGDKPAAEMLRRSLAPPSGIEGGCPDPEILAAYFERSLDAGETARHELHFSECARCREQLAAMVRAGESVGVVASQGGREASSAWSRPWDWRFMVPAFAALLIAAGVWYAVRPAQPRLVAMSTQPESLVAPGPQAPTEANAPAPPPVSTPAPEAKSEREPKFAETQSPALKKPESIAASTNLSTGAGVIAGVNSAAVDKKEIEPAAADQAGSAAASNTAQSLELPAAPAPREPAASPQPSATSGGAPAGISGFSAARAMTRSKQTLAAPTAAGPIAQDKAGALQATAEHAATALIHTPDPRILWRIAEGGFVERTTDGGETWEGQLPDANAQLIAGAAPTSKICWLAGSGGIILLTTDASNWKTISPPAPVDFVAITAKGASSATVTAADGRKFTTTDGGKRWNPAP